MDGSAMLTIVKSSTTMNDATRMSASRTAGRAAVPPG
jgi:hypothetical protein